jgi:RNA polymerase sigma-70 factor (ECF subfamily)
VTDSPDDTMELIHRAAAADPDATAQLMARHRERLKRMVAVRLDRRISARLDASDIVQDALAEAFKRLPAYLAEPPLPFYPWLRRLAWQRIVEAHRHHMGAERRAVGRERRVDVPLPDQSTWNLAAALVARQSSPSQHIMRQQRNTEVHDALGKLSQHDQELLVLRYLEQLSLADIAEILSCSEAAVKMRHMRALQRLGVMLTPPSATG